MRISVSLPSFRFAATALLFLVFAGTANASADGPLANQLKDHPSPYLELHAEDPTLWQGWSADVIERAKRENKLIYVSSGYFACHWCHVMQRQSFQDPGVAKMLNEGYIPVKLDRELNSALDSRLMDFAQATRGRGGWPLNVYLTPDGFPVYAHMYQPKDQFANVLVKLNEIWDEQRERLSKLAEEHSTVTVNPPTGTLDVSQVDRFSAGLVSILPDAMDKATGGFGDSAKFPNTPQLEFYLSAYARAPDDTTKEWLIKTLDSMINAGLRDHVGGGFYRYTVDPSWETPHFEKMLYTNALLSTQLMRAARILNKPEYADVARETWDFMIREMQTAEGALVASFSAVDDDGVEGSHYLWTASEVDAVLKDPERELFKAHFGIEGPMMFPNGYLPMERIQFSSAAKMAGVSEEQGRELLVSAKKKLYDVRQSRSLPVDTNLLAGWNGLALASFAEGAYELDEPRYVEAATRIRNYLVDKLYNGKELVRAVDDGKALGSVSVEDYAFVAMGLVAYARMTGEVADYEIALDIAQLGYDRFNRDNGWYLGESSLIIAEQARPALEDGSLPSPAAALARAALWLAEALPKNSAAQALRERSIKVLTPADRYLETNLFGFSSYVTTMMLAAHNHTTAKR